VISHHRLGLANTVFSPYPKRVKNTEGSSMKKWKKTVLTFLVVVAAGCGVQDGREVEYYKTGQLKSETHYKNGKKDGISIYWREDGTKLNEWQYTAGKLNGVCTSWYKNGQKSSEIHYKNGEKDGLDTKWREDGKKTNEWTFQDGEFISSKNL
jgi:hypothetical protein